MLALSLAQRNALATRNVMRRVFIWCEAKDPITGLPDPVGYWNDVGDVTVDGRLYHGSGTVIQVSTISGRGDMTIPGITITLSGIDPNVAALIRGEVIAQAPIDVKVGIYEAATKTIIPPLILRFVGFVDDVDIQTPEVGGDSIVVLTCESTSRALTIRRAATRSDSSAHERDPDDDIYQYTAVQRKPIYFGRPTPPDKSHKGGGG